MERIGEGGDGLLLVHRLPELAVLALLNTHLGRDARDAARGVVRRPRSTVGVRDVVPRQERVSRDYRHCTSSNEYPCPISKYQQRPKYYQIFLATPQPYHPTSSIEAP